jgi:hypothetical protein
MSFPRILTSRVFVAIFTAGLPHTSAQQAPPMYTGSWTDSMSQGLLISVSSWDAANTKATGTMEGPDMTEQIVKMRSVVEYPSATSRVMTAYAPGPDGKEMQVLKITYTKRK